MRGKSRPGTLLEAGEPSAAKDETAPRRRRVRRGFTGAKYLALSAKGQIGISLEGAFEARQSNRCMKDAFDFTGKVALVTGSSRGIGAGLLTALGQLGARCVVNYVADPAG